MWNHLLQEPSQRTHFMLLPVGWVHFTAAQNSSSESLSSLMIFPSSLSFAISRSLLIDLPFKWKKKLSEHFISNFFLQPKFFVYTLSPRFTLGKTKKKHDFLVVLFIRVNIVTTLNKWWGSFCKIFSKNDLNDIMPFKFCLEIRYERDQIRNKFVYSIAV